jgi:hypothetical protein
VCVISAYDGRTVQTTQHVSLSHDTTRDASHQLHAPPVSCESETRVVSPFSNNQSWPLKRVFRHGRRYIDRSYCTNTLALFLFQTTTTLHPPTSDAPTTAHRPPTSRCETKNESKEQAGTAATTPRPTTHDKTPPATGRLLWYVLTVAPSPPLPATTSSQELRPKDAQLETAEFAS